MKAKNRNKNRNKIKSKAGKALIKSIQESFPNAKEEEVIEIILNLEEFYKATSDVAHNPQVNWAYVEEEDENGEKKSMKMLTLSVYDKIGVSNTSEVKNK